jgi:hypothetical protein
LTRSSKLFLFLILSIQCKAVLVEQVGYQLLAIHDSLIKRDIDVALWYLTEAEARPESIGPLSLNVAINAPTSDKIRHLLILSHGFSGSHFGHHNIA